MTIGCNDDRFTMSDTQPLYVAVVDDDENFGRSLGRLLRAAGMQPITYTSGEAFLADTKHPRFDCLVFDIRLGGMSGIELGQRLRAEGRYAPFIMSPLTMMPRRARAPKRRAARRSSVRPIAVLMCST